MSHVLKIVRRQLNAKVVSYMLGGAGAVYVGFHGIANTFLMHQYQNLFQAYKDSTPVDVPSTLEKRYRQVLADLKIDEYDATLSKVFMTIRPDMHHIGFAGSKYSYRLGVPLKFTYNSEKDVNPNMKIELKFVDWNSSEGQLLQQSLVLSEDAQKFALAQEVLKTGMTAFYLRISYPTLSLALFSFLYNKGNELYQVNQKPIQARIVFVVGLCLCVYAVYVLLSDQTSQFLERRSLENISALGKDYVKGGIEYFDKQLNINKALRNLLHDGLSTYAASGNYNYFIRQPSLALTHQKSILEENLKSESLAPLTESELE